MSGTLPAGTVCYIIRSEQLPQFNGFAVEVVTLWQQEPGEWYEITSCWLRESFDSPVIARRENLLPLLPPAPETTERAKAVV